MVRVAFTGTVRLTGVAIRPEAALPRPCGQETREDHAGSTRRMTVASERIGGSTAESLCDTRAVELEPFAVLRIVKR
ncbi:uncharacterized protein RCC_05132 [Ramularia collo-cygni]|uniref:Uncharacterized protein n=1 Tax=Ramularia collo-cygni TaxID=112498 RepID=A0A2D3V6V7_9PEZI|nr:uncharacterized protein RCC_05132 [Ramularia collo-cygni]CZT19286.1 uncharacterized protein RCC_05132 [Ramularia collo-cygni]